MKAKLVLLSALLLPGCCWGNLHEGYVEGDRSTYEVLSPRLKEWIEEHPWAEEAAERDPTLRPKEAAEAGAKKQKDFKNKLDSWEARIKRAEKAIEEHTADEAEEDQ